MNFKGMQLVGFKSFADKTTITFDDGVTCIVGPNGCGKSNVADAVRWVLGEQSAKTMRGTSMQDVIFNGTEKRKSLSFCEVTLSFDNTSRIFDIDYDEVAMTRRLFRSGESEYLLNKKACRLKDIVALLHGVGIGKEGYSIIGQGKVEQIMNAKPEDRRAIFEEATGIMSFKSRKQEIERKLEVSTDSLNLFLQRMSEVERQVGPLSRQAETARKYNEYYTELRVVECNAYLYRYDHAAEEKAVIVGEGEAILAQIAAANREIEAVNAEMEKNRTLVAEADRTTAELNAKLLQLTVGLERKSGEAQRVKDRAGFFRNQLQAANDRVGYAMRRIESIERELKAGEGTRSRSEKRLAAAEKECEALTERLFALMQEISEFERSADENRAGMLSSAEDLSAVKEARGSLTARKEAARERLTELGATLDRLRSRRDGLQAEYDACTAEEMRLRSKIDDEPSQTASLREKAALAEERLDRIRQEIFDTNAKIASLRENYNFYVGLKNRFDGYKFSVKKLMGETRTDAEIARMVKGVIADIVTTEEKYEVAIETAFGGAMQNVVTATADDARRLIEHLKKTGGGIVTFLPVESMKPHFSSREISSALRETGAMGLAVDLVTYDPYYDNVIKNLLGNTLVCDNIYHATAIAKKYRSAFRIVTLDGDVVATSGAMTGGSKRQESGNLLANERKIKECEDAIEEKKAYLAKLEEMRLRGEKIKAENDAALQRLRSQFEETRTALATLLQKEETLTASLAETNESLTETAAAEGELRQKASAIESEYTLSAEDEEALFLKRAESEKLLARQQEQYALVKAEYEAKSARAGELRVEIAALRSAIEAESSSKERLLSEKESLVQELADTRKNIAGIETTISELDREAERKALTPEEQAEVDALRSEIASVADRKRVLNARNVLMDSNKSELTAKIASLQDQKFNCDLSLSKIDASLAAAEVRIAEEYELDYEGCLAYRVDGFELEGSGAKINSLKRKISALGAVNPHAIEDYEELRIRYEEMQTQQTDLEKGISDLKTVLEQIKGEMKRQFDQGFQTISENFKTTYRELFGGGRAELQMIYEEGTDPLDAGVEIFACPPGKKLTKISLLSGGERALTAIAILFAILKLRPMPFCILDEIEAALDEANVDRFAQYLKNFSKETQFIVITHRKPTMEQADSLFGVTMEEKGVSKIVSVRLSDLEAKLGAGTLESS